MESLSNDGGTSIIHGNRNPQSIMIKDETITESMIESTAQPQFGKWKPQEKLTRG